jgi:hypothetical protein
MKDIRLKGIYRIGPHNLDILSFIFGSLLGNASAQKRPDGTRIVFYKEDSHNKYLLFIHKYLLERGYSSIKVPKIYTILGNKGKIRKVIRCRT